MPSKQRKRRQTRAARSGRGASRRTRSRALADEADDEIVREPGVIVAHHGVAVEVRLDAGGRRPVRVRRRSGHVVGDRVAVLGERLERLERSNKLQRADALGKVHTVAANLDVLGIVVAPTPPSPSGFVDRALITAAAEGIRPFLVLNKCDLPAAAELAAQLRETWIDGPGGLDLPLFEVSAAEGRGLEALLDFFAGGEGRRGVFVGTSGVGKSSLVNALLPEVELAVGEINQYSGLGRHTTTTATLHALPRGGELIDTPGFRDFGLVDLSLPQLRLHFPGFEATLAAGGPCRFSDCRHLAEPDCTIKAAVEAGELAEARWQRYRDLAEELARLDTRR